VLALNDKYAAVPWVEKGSVCVIRLGKPGAVFNDDLKLIRQEEDNSVNYVSFNPFARNQVLTASNEKTALLWEFPAGDDDWTADVTVPLAKLEGHSARLMYAYFHPFVSGLAVTHAGDKAVKLWDVATGQATLSLENKHKALLTEIAWNGDGSQMATCAKDKFLRIFDPRSGATAGEVEAHPSTKTTRAVWCRRQDKIVTSGFARDGSRELALFDPRSLAKRLGEIKLDVSSSSTMPLFDDDTGVLFVCGKGDGTIHMFEVAASEAGGLFELNKYKSMQPQTGVALLPKTSLRVLDVEVDRVYKLTTSAIIPVSMLLDRANKDFFQDDIFIDTYDGKPAASAADWFGGASLSLGSVSLKPADS